MRVSKVLEIWNLSKNVYLNIIYHSMKTPFQGHQTEIFCGTS
jgi:hypothetical protein